MSDHQGSDSGTQTARLEPAVLYQPLQEATSLGGLEEGEGVEMPVAGGCPSTSDPCYKHIQHHSGSANEGGTGCPHQGGCSHGGSTNVCNIIGWVSIVGGPFIPEATVIAKGITVGAGAGLKAVCG